jgi:hypothetical protein
MRIAAAILAVLILAAPASAQPQGDQTPDVLNQVYACARVTSETERLACYDSAVGRLREAQSSGNLLAVDRAQAHEIERDAFGLSLPSLPRLFGRRNTETYADAVQAVEMRVARVEHLPGGRSSFTMENGQIWTQIEGVSARNVRVGGAVTVHQAALGSFLMSVQAGGPALRVRRTQ